MAALKPISENPSPTIPGAVVEWQSGAGRTFRFAVGEDGLVVGSAPGADIRLGQKDPPLLAAFRLCPGENGEGNRLHCRVLAPHCPLILNGQTGEIQTTLKARDRIEIAGHVGLIIQIAGAPKAPFSDRIGAPELAEYARALEAHAALVDQWQKSLEERQADLEKREQELQLILQEVIHRSENASEMESSPAPEDRNTTLEGIEPAIAEAISTPAPPPAFDNNSDGEKLPWMEPESHQSSSWEDEGDSWDFLTHPEAESPTGQFETSAQYWPPAEESEVPAEIQSHERPNPPVEFASKSDTIENEISEFAQIAAIPETFDPPVESLEEESEIADIAPLALAEELTKTISIQDNPAEPHPIETKPETSQFPFPVGEDLDSGSIEDLEKREMTQIEQLPGPENTISPEISEAIEDSPRTLENHLKPVIPGPALQEVVKIREDSGEISREELSPETWTIPLGDYVCSQELPGNGPIEAIHTSGSPKVFVEVISPEEPVGGHPAWEHENLPRELERQQNNDRDYRVWEIPQGPALMALELPPVLGIWYRLVLQTVLGVRALHSAGRCLSEKAPKTGSGWAVLEPSGLVKLYGPGVTGDNQTADLRRVGHLARSLWNKAFGQNAPQPEFIKDLLGRLTDQNGTFGPIESLDQLAVELDRIGLRIRANPYAWAALLQKTFPGWTSTPSKRLSA